MVVKESWADAATLAVFCNACLVSVRHLCSHAPGRRRLVLSRDAVPDIASAQTAKRGSVSSAQALFQAFCQIAQQLEILIAIRG